MGRKRVTPEIEQQILALSQDAELTQKSIGARVGVSHWIVMRTLQKHGVKNPTSARLSRSAKLVRERMTPPPYAHCLRQLCAALYCLGIRPNWVRVAAAYQITWDSANAIGSFRSWSHLPLHADVASASVRSESENNT